MRRWSGPLLIALGLSLLVFVGCAPAQVRVGPVTIHTEGEFPCPSARGCHYTAYNVAPDRVTVLWTVIYCRADDLQCLAHEFAHVLGWNHP